MKRTPKHIELDCGRPYTQVHAWLEDELGLSCQDATWLFERDGSSCAISIKPLPPRSFRHLALERTHIEAEGDERMIDAFMQLFTLRFISAGG